MRNSRERRYAVWIMLIANSPLLQRQRVLGHLANLFNVKKSLSTDHLKTVFYYL